MKDALDFLNESKLLEKALFKCYGRNGKSALVQTSHDDTFSSYFLSNDGAVILESLNMRRNRLLILLLDLIKSHSKIYGDNCKTLFFYVINALDLLLSSSSAIKDRQDTIAALRNTNMCAVYEKMSEEWNKKGSNVKLIENKSDIFKHLNSLSVMRDLNGFNRNLNEMCSSFLTRLIQIYMENEQFETIQDVFRELLNDLDHIVIYSDRSSLDESKLCENGFVLNLPFVLKNWKQFDDIRRVIIIIKEKANEQHANEITIEINDKLEENLNRISYAERTTFFPNTFLDDLKANQINLILMNSYLTDLQKAQLNSINISLISYLDYDFLLFLVNKLNIQPIWLAELSKNNLNQISDDSNNVIHLESFENLDQSSATNYYFKINKSIKSSSNSISFIYFCSPIKFVFHQFKTHMRKVLRTLANNMFEISKRRLCVRLLKSGSFEMQSLQMVQTLIQSESSSIKSDNLLLIQNFLYNFFVKFCLKHSHCSITKNGQEHSSIEDAEYEFLDLKLNLFMEFLYFVQNFLKIDEIHYHSSNANNIQMKKINII
jgi:hypothetical protein